MIGFASKVKQLREQNEMTQKQLGKILGLNQRTISSWETGARRPEYETLREVAKIFNVTVDYLLDPEDN